MTVSDAPNATSTSSDDGTDEAQPLVVANEFGRFAQIPRAILLSSISNNAKLVYAHLWDFSQGGGGDVHPSFRTLAERMGASVRSVQRWVSELVDCGAIAKSSRVRPDGSQTSNSYVIRAPQPVPPMTRVSPPHDTGVIPPHDTGVTPKKETHYEGGSQARARALPSSWVPNESHVARAQAAGLDIAAEAERFRLHAEATGRRMVNWNAAFTMWLSKSRPSGGSRPKPRTDTERMLNILDIDMSDTTLEQELEKRFT